MRRALLALLLTAIATAPAAAQTSHPRRFQPPPPPTWELSFGTVYTNYPDSIDLDDDFGFAARFGYLFTPHHELDFLFRDVDTNDSVFRDLTVRTDNMQAAYVYNFTKGGVVPYLTAGLGFFRTDDDALGVETDPVIGLGAGVRLFLGRVAYFRAEYRWNHFEGSGRVYVDSLNVDVNEATFGIGWRFPAF